MSYLEKFVDIYLYRSYDWAQEANLELGGVLGSSQHSDLIKFEAGFLAKRKAVKSLRESLM